MDCRQVGIDVPSWRVGHGDVAVIRADMLNTFQRLGVLSLVAFGLISSAELAQAGSNADIAQSGSTSDPASPRAPVPFARKAPVSVPTAAPDSEPVGRRAVSGPPEGAVPTEVTFQGGLDTNAAKAAVEADGYKRVTILGPGPNGAWRARGYRGDTEVGLRVDRDGSVTME